MTFKRLSYLKKDFIGFAFIYNNALYYHNRSKSLFKKFDSFSSKRTTQKIKLPNNIMHCCAFSEPLHNQDIYR